MSLQLRLPVSHDERLLKLRWRNPRTEALLREVRGKIPKSKTKRGLNLKISGDTMAVARGTEENEALRRTERLRGGTSKLLKESRPI